MNDFLSKMIEGNTPVERQVTYQGETGPVFFKRINAGQRAALLKGQKVQATAGEASRYEIDLGQNMITKHMLVQFSVCHADGSPRFKDLQAVQKLDAVLVDVLHEQASVVNSEQDESPGKS